MNIKYQFIEIGNANKFRLEIRNTFLQRVEELGLPDESITILNETNFHSEYKANSPSVCIYYGEKGSFPNADILNVALSDAVFILPVVDDLNNFQQLVPKELGVINGFELRGEEKVEALVGRLMEALSLLRASRRLFISYRRKESRSVAIQLYEYLDQCGFDVFLDTHSIRPGDSFQDELWHRLVDTDVVVLLDTPGFLESRWTEEELAKASAMSIGVLQLIWPEHIQKPYSKLCFPVFLNDKDFDDGDFTTDKANLTDDFLKKIGSQVESLRARSLASRQDNLIQEFVATSKSLGKVSNLQPEKFITLSRKDGKEIALIPTVGVPNAFTYNQTEELIKSIRESSMPEVYLLYDHRSIIEKWQKHLIWLDLYLPVRTLRVTEIPDWLNKI